MKIIINADDLGMTNTCTNAIIEAFSKGLISSATLCANGEFYDHAVELIYKNRLFDNIGIHLNLTTGTPLTDEIRNDKFFCDNNGLFHGKINRKTSLTSLQKNEIYNEFVAQIRKLINSGIKITHSDSHHHIHTAFHISMVTINALKDYDINKIRISRNVGNINIFKRLPKYLFNCYLQRYFLTTKYFGSLNDIKNSYPLCEKSLEIMVHPDYDKNNILINRNDIDSNGSPLGEKLSIPNEYVSDFSICSYYNLR